jgi:hypothetical protein
MKVKSGNVPKDSEETHKRLTLVVVEFSELGNQRLNVFSSERTKRRFHSLEHIFSRLLNLIFKNIKNVASTAKKKVRIFFFEISLQTLSP